MDPVSPPTIRSDTYRLIEQLVSFDTTSRQSNLNLIEWVRDYLKGLGVPTRLTYDAARNKANLFAQLGEGSQPGIVLSGHTDVVPVDGQDWHTDPFAATVVDDRILGRGTADMKSFIAVSLGSARRFLAAPLKAPVYYALSYDEEVGCLGVRGLLADLARNDIRPAGCIVGEPTGMQLVGAHKGKRSYRCCLSGKEAHSALAPRGVNAIEYGARLIVHIRQTAERLRENERRDDAFDVPFTTLQTGTIAGGTAVNIVPRECAFEFELRYLSGTDPDTLEREIKAYAESILLPEMRRIDPDTSITFENISDIPGLDSQLDADIVRLARVLTQGATEHMGKVAYATEAGLFQRAGIPAVIVGPGLIEQAHKPDEFITLSQVARCETFMDRLIEELCR